MTQPYNLGLLPHHPQLSLFMELKQSLASRVVDISPFVDRLMQFLRPLIAECSDEDGSELDIEIALREAIANAVIHGNDEDPEKRVHVTCSCSMDREVLLRIRDEGEGFDSCALPDPADEKNLLLTHGRGIRLMQTLMDEVSFEDRGTVVRMRKRLQSPVE